MTVRPERRLAPLTTTDEYLAEILGELRDLNARLAQDPPDSPDPTPEPDDPAPVLVTEPAPMQPPPAYAATAEIGSGL